jgi:hypothetical protein
MSPGRAKRANPRCPQARAPSQHQAGNPAIPSQSPRETGVVHLVTPNRQPNTDGTTGRSHQQPTAATGGHPGGPRGPPRPPYAPTHPTPEGCRPTTWPGPRPTSSLCWNPPGHNAKGQGPWRSSASAGDASTHTQQPGQQRLLRLQAPTQGDLPQPGPPPELTALRAQQSTGESFNVLPHISPAREA